MFSTQEMKNCWYVRFNSSSF